MFTLLAEAKDLLTLTIQRQDYKQFLELYCALQAVYGNNFILNWLFDEIVRNLPAPLFRWVGTILAGGEAEYLRVTKEAATKVVRSLIEKGFTLGQDFSLAADGGLLLAATKSKSLLQNIPEEFRDICTIV